MCDPVSAGLVAVGEGLKYYAGTQVESASKRDIRNAGAQYDAERARQGAFTKENEGSVASTLNAYSPQAAAARTQDAADSRGAMYTAPLQNHSFTATAPADYDPNSLIQARNAATGNTANAHALSQALAKAQLDAYGDSKAAGSIISNDNANRIGTVNRIASGSERAGAIEQGTLQSKLAASAHQGDTAGGIGDLFMLAASANGLSGGSFGSKLFGGTSVGAPAGTTLQFGQGPISGSTFLNSTAPSLNTPGVFGMNYPALTRPFF